MEKQQQKTNYQELDDKAFHAYGRIKATAMTKQLQAEFEHKKIHPSQFVRMLNYIGLQLMLTALGAIRATEGEEVYREIFSSNMSQLETLTEEGARDLKAMAENAKSEKADS